MRRNDLRKRRVVEPFFPMSLKSLLATLGKSVSVKVRKLRSVASVFQSGERQSVRQTVHGVRRLIGPSKG